MKTLFSAIFILFVFNLYGQYHPRDYNFYERGYIMLFHDDFKDNSNNWNTKPSKIGKAMVINKSYQIECVSDDNAYITHKYIPIPTAQNYQITATIKYVSGPNEKFSNFLVVGWKDDDNQLKFGFKKDSISIVAYEYGEKNPISKVTKCEALKKSDNVELTIRTYRDSMYFFVNGDLVKTSKNFILPGSSIGFICTSKNKIIVSNLLVLLLLDSQNFLTNFKPVSNEKYSDDIISKVIQKHGQNFNIEQKKKVSNQLVAAGNCFAENNCLVFNSQINKYVIWDNKFYLSKPDNTNIQNFGIANNYIDLNKDFRMHVEFEVESQEQIMFGFSFNSSKTKELEVLINDYKAGATIQINETENHGLTNKILDNMYCNNYKKGKNELIIGYSIEQDKYYIYLNNVLIWEFKKPNWNETVIKKGENNYSDETKYCSPDKEIDFITQGVGKVKIYSVKYLND